MTTHELLQALQINEHSAKQLAFMVAEYKKTSDSNGYFVYRSTPLRCIWDWYNTDKINPAERVRSKILDYPILNSKCNCPCWLSGGDWNGAINRGEILMPLVVSPEELYTGYKSKEQADCIVKYCGEKIKEQLKKGIIKF